jgi:hypothetical protein
VAAVAIGVACGGSDGLPSGQPAAGSSAPSTQASTAKAAPNRCPLTAAQVTAAVGSAVKPPDSSCGFFPADENKLLPRVLFVNQSTAACTDAMLAEMGFKEKVDGLGVVGYVADQGDGTHLLVCRQNAPFDLSVDLADNAKARAAAMTLARQVLTGS